MDYLVHQRRLFPLIARSYALQFAQNELVAKCHELQTSDDPDRRGAARAGVARRGAEGRQHLARHPRHPGGARSLRRRRLSRREPADRAQGRHRRVHHLRGRQPRADPAGGQGTADRLRRRHQGHEPGGVGAVRGELRRRAGAETHCGADDHADHPRHPGGQRGRGQPVQPRHPGQDVRGPRGVHARLGRAAAAGQVQGDVARSTRSTPCRTTCCTPRRRTSTGSSSRRSSPASTRARTTEAREILGLVCDLYALSVIEERQGVVRRAPLPVDRARQGRHAGHQRPLQRLRPYAETAGRRLRDPRAAALRRDAAPRAHPRRRRPHKPGRDQRGRDLTPQGPGIGSRMVSLPSSRVTRADPIPVGQQAGSEP